MIYENENEIYNFNIAVKNTYKVQIPYHSMMTSKSIYTDKYT